jgi:hypothetical protein
MFLVIGAFPYASERPRLGGDGHRKVTSRRQLGNDGASRRIQREVFAKGFPANGSKGAVR